MPPEKIDVLVHPQSVVHSLVEFIDRSCLAQMSVPDMRGPISYALSYPDRIADSLPPLELDMLGTLTFSRPDNETFPCLSYAYEAIRAGGTMPCVLNAANEAAVNAFLHGRLGFNDIPRIIRKTLDSHGVKPVSVLDDVLEADRLAREKAEAYIKEIKK
jgi:1-deoxy-D-xylulose-5-phosphate reductoisomerase